MIAKRNLMWIGVAACGLVLLGVVIFALRDRSDDRRDVTVVPPTTAPAPPQSLSSATAPASHDAPQPMRAAATAAATAPANLSLDQRLAVAQQQAQAAYTDLQAARKAALERLAQQPDYQQARQGFDAAEAKVKTLRQTNEQPALAAVSQEWMTRKNALTKLEATALNGDPPLRAAAARVATAANETMSLQRQLAERDAAARQQQELAARTARAVDEAVDDLAARAKASLQLLVARGVIESVDPNTGDVRVDPLVWEPINSDS